MVPRYMFTQGYNVLGQIVMKRSHIDAVLNFDLCDVPKFGDDPAISSGVIVLYWFSKMATWQTYLKSDRDEIR
jgi:hypothetical protein